jgi:hypothetical protein
MKEAGLGHPFELEINSTLPKSDWLLFLKEARRNGVNLNDSTEVYHMLIPMVLKDNPTPPSPASVTGASPPSAT